MLVKLIDEASLSQIDFKFEEESDGTRQLFELLDMLRMFLEKSSV